jgi:hypothetical protein
MTALRPRLYYYAGINPGHKGRICYRVTPWYKWPRNQLVRWIDTGELCIVIARTLRRIKT